MLRGSAPTKIDDKGRLKVPSAFSKVLEASWGREVFVTSLRDDYALLYPLPAWEELELKLRALPSALESAVRFRRRVNYYGQQTQLDNQGRLVLPQNLREVAGLDGDAVVFGSIDHLEIWNRERFERSLRESPLSEGDFIELAEKGI
jgi:MraZ protein